MRCRGMWTNSIKEVGERAGKGRTPRRRATDGFCLALIGLLTSNFVSTAMFEALRMRPNSDQHKMNLNEVWQ